MKSSENFESEQAMSKMKYPKPKCRIAYCGNDCQAFNDRLCHTHTNEQYKTVPTNQNKVSMCCEKCFDTSHGEEGFCNTGNCPCHTEKGGEEGTILFKGCRCQNMFKTTYEICHHQDKACHAIVNEGERCPPHSFSMEERFEEKFPSSRHTSQIYPKAELHEFINQEIQSARIAERESLWTWIEYDIGVSSKAIFRYMTKGIKPDPFDAPSDGGDRARCIVLLKAAPEWIPRLSEISDLKDWNEQIPLILASLK